VTDPPAIAATELFDPEFLEALQRLHLVTRRVAGGGRPAEQRSRDRGPGIEFRDYRQYSPGDDFRAIDWTIYRRLGRVFLRLFEELEDLPVYILPDVSKSSFLEQPPRAKAGLRCALALAAIALNQHDSVGIVPFGADLEVALRPGSGKGRVMRVASVLSALEPMGETDVGTSLRKFMALGLRAGLVVVISDFFDPRGGEAVVAALKRLRHRLLLVQLVRRDDRDPGLQGDLQLRDCETGAIEDVSATPAVRERYRVAYDRFQQTLVDFARHRSIGLLQLDVERDVLAQLAVLFEHGSYVV
jgi:uncharacterized protein (DUF58 family)